MPKTLSEQNIENAMVADLVKLNGFHIAGPTDYDRELCLIPHALVRFLQVTQPQAWKELRTELGDEAESRIVKRVRNVIEKKGTLHVLRKGVDESGCHFELCFFPSAGRHDPELDFHHKGSKEAKIAKLHALTDPLIAQFRQMDENDLKNFKSLMRDYVKLYGFLSQLIPFRDARLEIKFYKKVQDDQDIAKALFDQLFERYLASKR
jgi:hypothetical protein